MRKSGSQGVLIGYISVMKKIDNVLADKIDTVRKLFINAGKEMLLDFRTAQQNAEKLKSYAKGQNEETANTNVAEAVAFAHAHKNEPPFFTRGKTWFNRSGRAVRGVVPIIDADSETISLKLSHSVYYGAYLEYGHNRRYAVLEPLVREYAPGLIAEVKRVMGAK